MNAPMTPEQRKAITVQIGDVQPATDALIGTFAESVANIRNHEHPSWEDLYCMNLTSYMGERMTPVLKRLLVAESEADQLRARVAELEAQRDRRRARLVALQNDALSMRGSLSPNGEASKVPFELGETLTPAVDWLINRVAELEAALADATEPDVDGAGRTYQEYNPGSRDLRPGADAARRMIRDRQVAEGPRAPRQVTPVEAFAYDMDQALVDLSTEERRGADLVLQVLRARATAADVPTAEDAS